MTSAGQLNLRCRGKISLKLHWRQQSSSWCLIQRFDGTGPLALADVDRNWPNCSTFFFIPLIMSVACLLLDSLLNVALLI